MPGNNDPADGLGDSGAVVVGHGAEGGKIGHAVGDPGLSRLYLGVELPGRLV